MTLIEFIIISTPFIVIIISCLFIANRNKRYSLANKKEKENSEAWEKKFHDLEISLQTTLEGYVKRNRDLQKINTNLRAELKEYKAFNIDNLEKINNLKRVNHDLEDFKKSFDKNLRELQNSNSKLSEDKNNAENYAKVVMAQMNETRAQISKYEDKYGII